MTSIDEEQKEQLTAAYTETPDVEGQYSQTGSESSHLSESTASPSSIVTRILHAIKRVLLFIPTWLAIRVIRPLGAMKHSVLGKLLVVVTIIYLIAASSLYMFTGEYHPFGQGHDIARSIWMYWQGWSDTEWDPQNAPQAMLADPSDVQPFDWNDWLDLRIIHRVANAANETRSLWPFSDDPFKDIKFPPKKPGTEDEIALIGQYYLSQKAPIPKSVVFVAEDREVKVVTPEEYAKFEKENEKRELKEGDDDKEKENEKDKEDESESEESDDGDEDEDSEEGAAEEEDDNDKSRKKKPATATSSSNPPVTSSAKTVAPTSDTLFPEFESADPADKILVDIDRELFDFDEEKMTTVTDDMTDDERKHAEWIKTTLEHVKNSPKHFHEVPLKQNSYLGVHYDWRFFNRVRHGKSHEAFMHHLIRAWSAFTERENIMSLIAHGSLIGYYFDGMAMPWDADNDVQMPIMELDRFARKYNQTLVVEDPKEGNGRYLIDVSPWYVDRKKVNGNNVIDARFIDIRSGIYLDITGLAVTRNFDYADDEVDVNCKSPHYYRLNQLSPARRTLYEGVEVYVPYNIDDVLESEYNPKFRNRVFNGWRYDNDLRLWLEKGKCDLYQVRKKKFKNGELTLYGACDNEDILEEYQKSKDVTVAHDREMDLYRQMRELPEGSPKIQDIKSKIASLLKVYHKPLRDDPQPK